MKRISYLEKLSPWGKLILLLVLILLSALVSALLGMLIGKVFFGLEISTMSHIFTNPETAQQILFIKLYQFINQIGVFIIPVFIFSFLVSSNSFSYLNINKPPNTTNVLIMGVVVFSYLPFLNYLGDLNQSMTLPEALSWVESWMLDKEIQAKQLTETFLKTNSIGGLAVNLILVSLIPAIGEELLFRGLFLKLFKRITASSHWAVIISAFIFAAIHMQFYGFLPRFFLGLVLGYSFLITQNLWMPIFIHLLNNAASVVVYFLHYNGYLKIPMEDFGSVQSPVYIIGSLLITVWLMVIVYRREGNSINN